MHKTAIALAVMAAVSGAAVADEASSITEALAQGSANLSVRYRFESVDQDGFADTAEASTARFRLTYNSGSWKGLSFVGEMDHLAEVWETDYNSKTNGNTAYPVIADPLYTELNQGYLRYTGFANTEVRYGRQRINLDNQRFVGGVGWRQNEQTYDGVTIINTSLPDTTIVFSSLYNVNTILGGDLSDGQHEVLNVKYTGFGSAALTGYAYLLENISDTYGLRLTGKTPVADGELAYTAEFATQQTDDAASIDTNYYFVEGQMGFKGGWKAMLGYEVHTADSGVSFQTPLGTNHAFNGWADKFLLVPGEGLEDLYLGGSTKFAGNTLKLVYHDFSAESASRDYGTEWDVAVSRKIGKHYGLLFKVASYSADTLATDTTKFWLQLTAKF
jgi:hypothetical protein